MKATNSDLVNIQKIILTLKLNPFFQLLFQGKIDKLLIWGSNFPVLICKVVKEKCSKNISFLSTNADFLRRCTYYAMENLIIDVHICTIKTNRMTWNIVW